MGLIDFLNNCCYMYGFYQFSIKPMRISLFILLFVVCYLSVDLSIACRWLVFGLSLACRWLVFGLSLACLWLVFGLSLACLWLVSGLSLACLWLVFGLSLACLWLVFSLSLTCPQQEGKCHMLRHASQEWGKGQD